jgi:two-component system chemotaxis sensor kinase CheA
MPKRRAPAPPPPPFTLDDAAALLLQLGVGDGDELRRLQTELENLAFDGGLNPAAQARVAGAARRIREAVFSGGDEGTAALVGAGELLEQAMAAMAGLPVKESAPTPVPAAARTPGAKSVLIPAEELLDAADPSLLADFINESREYMEAAEAALLELETNPQNKEAINTVFRAFHTIKGTSAFLGLQPISELAHHAESLFNRFREGELLCTGPRADLSLRAVDMLTAVLALVDRSADSGEVLRLPKGYPELMSLLEDPGAAGILDTQGEVGTVAPPRLGDILVAEGKADRQKIEAVMAGNFTGPLGLALVREHAASLTDVAQALRKQQRAAGPETTDSSVRIRTDRLDLLIDMVGELVIAQSMVVEDAGIVGDHHSELSRKVAHAGKIVRDLQELSVSLRMVPLKATFQRMARLVRDVARKSGKRVEFVTDGEETEIDRSMVDVIGDPLVHMIRNAIDHGIEAPDVRPLKGKPAAGTLRLSSYHSGGNVVVELQDDGRGLDRDRIVAKAVSNGLIESGVGMTDAEILNLIFAPGFSTADTVTDLSGRGVGMDVVKRNVESLRGRIDIASVAGKGCTFSIRLPLTLAVTDGMLVQVAGERYIVPTVNIQMSFRPSRDMLSTVAGKGEMVLLRGELLPIVRLHQLFEVEGAETDPLKALLVIIGFGDRRCALLVDELLGQYQLVAKTLGEGLGFVEGISGGAILGDGRVGLILDVSGIVALAREEGATVHILDQAAS